MSLVDSITNVLRTELKCYTAWPPMAMKVSLGDYGTLQGGVFNKLGNIASLRIPYESEAGPSLQLDFTSADATVTRATAAGAVDVFPQGGVDASMRVSFASADALMLRAASIAVQAMSNVATVAAYLKSIHAAGWDRSNVVVGAVLLADKPLLIGTREGGTEVTFQGKTDALKALEIGRLEGDVGFSSNKELALKILGESGVLGLRLFRLRLFGNQPSFLGPDAGGGDAQPDFEWLSSEPKP
jgi:hypothetical protein